MLFEGNMFSSYRINHYTDDISDDTWTKITASMKICNKSQTTKSPATENPPTSKQTTIAKLDSGASANYFRFQDAMHCLDDIHEDDGPSAITPTLETIKATKAGSLPLAQKNLSDDARKAHIFNKLGSASLISVANICDDGCQVLFDRNHAYITKNKKLLIKN